MALTEEQKKNLNSIATVKRVVYDREMSMQSLYVGTFVEFELEKLTTLIEQLISEAESRAIEKCIEGFISKLPSFNPYNGREGDLIISRRRLKTMFEVHKKALSQLQDKISEEKGE